MTPLWIAFLSWCAGIVLLFWIAHPLWWVSAFGLLPLVMGMWVGYRTGENVAAERYRNQLRNQSAR